MSSGRNKADFSLAAAFRRVVQRLGQLPSLNLTTSSHLSTSTTHRHQLPINLDYSPAPATYQPRLLTGTSYLSSSTTHRHQLPINLDYSPAPATYQPRLLTGTSYLSTSTTHRHQLPINLDYSPAPATYQPRLLTGTSHLSTSITHRHQLPINLNYSPAPATYQSQLLTGTSYLSISTTHRHQLTINLNYPPTSATYRLRPFIRHRLTQPHVAEFDGSALHRLADRAPMKPVAAVPQNKERTVQVSPASERNVPLVQRSSVWSGISFKKRCLTRRIDPSVCPKMVQQIRFLLRRANKTTDP